MARTVVVYMENGMGVRETCMRDIRDILALNETGEMSCLAFDGRARIQRGTSKTRESCNRAIKRENLYINCLPE
jgi:hypothetical protein